MTSLLTRNDRRARIDFSMLGEGDDHSSWPLGTIGWPAESDHAAECEHDGKDFSLPFATVLATACAAYPEVAMDPDFLAGAPRIAGTRIPLYMLVRALRHFGTIEAALSEYPDVTIEQMRQALGFAASVLEQPLEYELEDTGG